MERVSLESKSNFLPFFILFQYSSVQVCRQRPTIVLHNTKEQTKENTHTHTLLQMQLVNVNPT